MFFISGLVIAGISAGVGWSIAKRIDVPTEYRIGGLVACTIVTPLLLWGGWMISFANAVTYHEYWNGWELQAEQQVTTCTRDGSCLREYDCDSYQCNPHDCNCRCTSYDKDGNCTNTECDTCYDTCYHDCPYSTEEWTFVVKTTLQDFTIADGVIPDNAQPWRGWKIPGYILNRYQTGVPPFWQAAFDRIAALNPGAVTVRRDYENFILASESSILRAYSDQIDAFKTAGLLPDLQKGIRDFYNADKVYFVGYQSSDPSAWQVAHTRLNAALGTELQGDLHLVLVQDQRIDQDQTTYLLALKAYWQDTKVWGKDALSKNAVIVILGTDGTNVTWAQAQTGMPVGNEAMITAIHSYFMSHTVPMTAKAVLGTVRGEKYEKTNEEGEVKTKVRGVIEGGALTQILFGVENPQTRFERVSMSAQEVEDVGTGFTYLTTEFQPKWWQTLLTMIAAFAANWLTWYGIFSYGAGKGRSRNNRYPFLT